jgi:hypothetical protein
MALQVVQDVARQIEQLAGGVYTAKGQTDLPRYVKYCFDQMESDHGTYIGVDSNLPSQGMEEYAWFLALHEKKLDRLNPRDGEGKRHGVQDYRVIVGTASVYASLVESQGVVYEQVS